MKARRPLVLFLCIVSVVCVCAGCGSEKSGAQNQSIPFQPCQQVTFGQFAGNTFMECGRLTVPVDYVNPTRTLSLAVIRQPATDNAERTRAVFTFSGGPGGASVPFFTRTVELFADVLKTHDLVTFDQRGTGSSQPLACPEIVSVFGGANQAEQQAVQRCSKRLGSDATHYGTTENVEDIERLRSALGYEKITLYGLSYGTYLVQRYAARYPQRVERLILDSPIPATGGDPWKRSSFQAVPRVLSALCKHNDCRYATTNVKADFMRVAQRLKQQPASGFLIDGRGKKQPAKITAAGFFQTLLGEDLDPVLRAQLPAALGAAANRDMAPLLRLQYQAARYFSGGSAQNPLQINHGLYLATRCADGPLPWQPTAERKQRLQQARKALQQLSSKTFSPFSRETAFQVGDIFRCAAWPKTTPPPTENPPAVATLVLSGELDLRTPTEDARKVTNSIFVNVPNGGHSVLYADLSGCARRAVKAFMQAQNPEQCSTQTAIANGVLIAARPPKSVMATAPLTGKNSLAAKAASAALLTLFDARYQVSAALTTLSPSPQIGGLRAGKLQLTPDWLTKAFLGVTPQMSFKGFTFVPKIALWGTAPGYGNGQANLKLKGVVRGSLTVTFKDSTVIVNGKINNEPITTQITFAG